MHSITLWIQFIIFLHAGRCSWPDKWKLQQSPQLSVSVSKASGPWHLQSSQKGKKRCQVLHLPSWKKFGFSLTFFFLKLFFGYKLRSHTLVALQATAEFYHTWYEASLQVSGTDLTPAQSLLVLHRAIITVFFCVFGTHQTRSPKPT